MSLTVYCVFQQYEFDDQDDLVFVASSQEKADEFITKRNDDRVNLYLRLNKPCPAWPRLYVEVWGVDTGMQVDHL
jgi:hypothetical protein